MEEIVIPPGSLTFLLICPYKSFSPILRKCMNSIIKTELFEVSEGHFVKEISYMGILMLVLAFIWGFKCSCRKRLFVRMLEAVSPSVSSYQK
jgi:hypothetical protein